MPSPLGMFTSNWKLKLLALALAVLLWVVVSAEQVTSNWIPVPLQVRVNDPDVQLLEETVPREVEVRFAGPGRELWDLVIRRPPLLLTINEVDDTRQTFNLEARMVQVPSQLSVNAQDVRPGALTLNFIRVESRLVPVRVRLGRGPGAGWTLVDSLESRPSRVRVSGPEALLARVEAVSTVPLDVAPGDTSFERTVALDTAGLTGLQLSATRVRVSGRVDQLLDRTYGGVPIEVGSGIAVRPAVVDVRVVGARSVIRDLMPGDFRVVVSIDSIPGRIPPEGLQVPLRVERLPAGVQAETSPGRVRLLADRAPPDTAALSRPAAPRDTTQS